MQRHAGDSCSDPPNAPVPQLLRSPFFDALSSSIFFTRSLNSSYWHFSYECRSSWPEISTASGSFFFISRILRHTSHFQGR